MSRELWKAGIKWREQRPDGVLRHGQLITSFGPGALADFVSDAAIVAGLGFWAKGEPIVETPANSYATFMRSGMDALIDDLVSRGVLPTASGQAAGGFTPVAGSWRSP